MSPEALTQIGKYRVFQLVGEGAMGIVYRAQDTVLARTVALKVMTDAIARDEDLRERFLREAQAAGSLQHPNVVTIFDFGETDGHLYIAMEFVEGVDLETVLEERQPLTLDAKLGVVVDLLTGLSYAHKRGIVHRDVKPANIRLTDDGRAKIMDFGIVHLTSSNMTRTGMMMGTPSYMAPEQVTGAAVTPATDIFAAGVVLYELLTGVKPFDAPTLHSILFKIVSEEPRDVLTLVPSLPAGLNRIVNRALSKDPHARYASALEMANELSVVRAGVSGEKSSGTLSLRASLDARRNTTRRALAQQHARRVAQWGGGALAAAAAVATIWMAVESRRSADAAAAPASAAAPATTTASLGPPAVGVPPTGRPASTATRTATRTASIDPSRTDPSRAGATASRQPVATGVARMVTPPAPPPPASPHRDAATPERTASTGVPAQPTLPAPGVTTQRVTLTQPPVTPTTVATPPVVAPSAVSSSASASGPSASAGVSDAIAAYAHAIQSRDVGAIRRVYPGISSTQQQGFEQFFDAARALRVNFSIASLDVSGTSADARVVGTYDYTGADGRSMRQPVSFRASLRQDAGAWRLVAVQ